MMVLEHGQPSSPARCLNWSDRGRVLQRGNIVRGMQDVVFLPGIVAPVSVRYGPLLERLPGVHAVLKDLEVYATEEPPARYSVQTEIDGIEAAADSAGLERFHLYGHSGGVRSGVRRRAP